MVWQFDPQPYLTTTCIYLYFKTGTVDTLA